MTESKKRRMVVAPLSGAELQGMVGKVMDQPPEIVSELKRILK